MEVQVLWGIHARWTLSLVTLCSLWTRDKQIDCLIDARTRVVVDPFVRLLAVRSVRLVRLVYSSLLKTFSQRMISYQVISEQCAGGISKWAQTLTVSLNNSIWTLRCSHQTVRNTPLARWRVRRWGLCMWPWHIRKCLIIRCTKQGREHGGR